MELVYRVLTGPTASGKTACLLRRAAAYRLAVVSADSRQIYRGMDIGTGTPTPADLEILPHYLINLVEPPISFSVYQFLIEVARVLRDLETNGQNVQEVWVCGGTGLYIRALVEDLPLKAGPRPRLRGALEQALEQRATSELAELLGLKLAEPSNPVRVIRACEVACEKPDECQRLYDLAGLSQADVEADEQQAGPDATFEMARACLRKWNCKGIAVLDPGVDALYSLIEHRVRGMFAEGLVDEVQQLCSNGYGDTQVVSQGIAYREALGVLDGELGLDEAIKQAVIRTRQYAKRQRTYFRGLSWPVCTTCEQCMQALGVA